VLRPDFHQQKRQFVIVSFRAKRRLALDFEARRPGYGKLPAAEAAPLKLSSPV